MMRRVLGLSALALAFAAPLGAQVWNYPALQTSRVSEREYNFALTDGNGTGTALVFQWREGLGNPRLQFTMDAGFADPDAAGADTRLMIGGGLGYQATSATADMPFDIVIAGGIGATFGDDVTTIRIPIGASIGHRFALEGKYAISPFVHPRLSWNRVSFNGFSDSDTGLDVDIGANFELSEQMAIRLAAALGDSDAIGLSFAWTPRGLRK
ncbi:MAG: outer membrane beta-barrel protein [Gemmatimonadales bacterium]|nr:outer membrane beta-barrel protein [Gemmatimonadota bacterium]MCL4214135.1 outer membrane beta-barrel protein [Gemmatimonadales bacterium]